MKEQYISEIMHYLNTQDEKQIKGLAELSRIVDTSKLIYIITFVKNLFGSQ